MEQWVKQLIDLGGRNQLLYYKSLPRGTLELSAAAAVPLDALLAGGQVRLSRLLPAPDDNPAGADEALRRAQTLHRRAVELFEERGIQTLYLAWGMATWHTEKSAATPAAPVLLRPLTLKPAGAAERDFDLELGGDWEVNATLLHLLATEFGVDVDAEGLNGALEYHGAGTPDPSPVHELLVKQATDVPDFEIVRRVVAGTFTYTKLPMVRDLEESGEALAEHDVVAAMAGDEGAQAAVQALHARDVDPSDPDRTPPQDEFLIRDADGSQQYAINATVAGEPLVIQGPPGTGKSQTIANLVATLAARGQRVLFVAEKRAAIEAVTKRLDQVGLAELVLDLHSGARSKKQLATELSGTLERIRATAPVNLADLHHELASNRDALCAHAAALHERRSPWEVSLWEVQDRLLDVDGHADAGVRWTGQQLVELDAVRAREVRDAVEEWAGLVSPFLDGRTPWADATVTSQDDAARSLSLAQELASSSAPGVAAELDRLVSQSTLPAPVSVADCADLLHLLNDVGETAAVLDDTAWDENLEALATRLEPGRRSVWARMAAQLGNVEYRRAKKAARALWTGGEKPTGKRVAHAIEAARGQTARWHRIGGASRPRPVEGVAVTLASYRGLREQLTELAGYLGRDLAALSHRELPDHAAALTGDQATLYRLPRIHELESWLVEQHCHGLLHAIHQRRVPHEQARAAFDCAWLGSLRTHLLATDQRLAGFDGDLQRRRVAQFADADARHIATTPQRVQRAVAERAVAARTQYPEQDQVISKQARLKRGHMPLRQLVRNAPDVLTSLRPCWAMSPLVVSQSLPLGELFDVVVFDEASQIIPADAVPAIARARQVIVAGDDRQLPPTAFFGTNDEGDDGDDEEDGRALTAGFESILDVLGALLRSYTLTWHYRSEDERLIAFSNHHVYDGSLVTFPGVAGRDCLDFQLVPHRAGAKVNSRSNDDEVARVVDLMLDHAHRRPDESLGVIALGSAHANRIDVALRDRLAAEADHDLEAFFDETLEERAFIKNLERVQGDERDAIILSTGYAKSPDGRVLYRFGPINQDGGGRRLNVAVTRARRRITLVSSFTHTEMDPEKGSDGARLLRSYLKYAASHGTDLDGAEAKAPLNAFERSVKNRLEAEGLTVIPQYGTSGYRIDFAVPNPDQPDRMLLAIEADGASYHSSPTARDRDRLRQRVLEKRGWTFHRIWSTDWFTNPDAETTKALDALRLAQDAQSQVPRPHANHVATGPAPITGNGRSPRPAVAPGGTIADYSHEQLVAVADWIRSDTLLRTEDELLAEMMRELGFTRRGKRIVSALQVAIRDSEP